MGGRYGDLSGQMARHRDTGTICEIVAAEVSLPALCHSEGSRPIVSGDRGFVYLDAEGSLRCLPRADFLEWFGLLPRESVDAADLARQDRVLDQVLLLARQIMESQRPGPPPLGSEMAALLSAARSLCAEIDALRSWPPESTQPWALAELSRLLADLRNVGEDLTDEQRSAINWLGVAVGRVSLLRSVLSHPAADEWRPLTAVQRDGETYLLGWYDDSSSWCAAEGWFEPGPADGCWYSVSDDRVYPTHYRPRTAPPRPPTEELR